MPRSVQHAGRPSGRLPGSTGHLELDGDRRQWLRCQFRRGDFLLDFDDVLDDAGTRRHVATVNNRWNTETSVLFGDFLFTHAFHLASSLESTDACRFIGRATNVVCEGELLQNAESGNFHLSREEYLRIIDAKTAELCACCCRLGVHYAGGDKQVVSRFESFGRHLGIAFQIADDLLDVEGDETLAGKALRKDEEQGKQTFVTLMGVEQARAQATMLVEQAGDHLASYGDDARLLVELAHFIVKRDH